MNIISQHYFNITTETGYEYDSYIMCPVISETNSVKYETVELSDVNSKETTIEQIKNSYSGNFSFNLRKQTLAMVLSSLFTNRGDGGTGGNEYYSFDNNDSMSGMTRSYLKMIYTGTDISGANDKLVTLYNNVIFNSIDITCENREFIIASAKWDALELETSTSTAKPDNEDDGDVAIFYGANIYRKPVSSEVPIYTKSFTISFVNSYEIDYSVNSHEPTAFISSGTYSIKGDFELSSSEFDTFKTQFGSSTLLTNNIIIDLRGSDVSTDLICRFELPNTYFVESTQTQDKLKKTFKISFVSSLDGALIRVYK